MDKELNQEEREAFTALYLAGAKFGVNEIRESIKTMIPQNVTLSSDLIYAILDMVDDRITKSMSTTEYGINTLKLLMSHDNNTDKADIRHKSYVEKVVLKEGNLTNSEQEEI